MRPLAISSVATCSAEYRVVPFEGLTKTRSQLPGTFPSHGPRHPDAVDLDSGRQPDEGASRKAGSDSRRVCSGLKTSSGRSLASNRTFAPGPRELSPTSSPHRGQKSLASNILGLMGVNATGTFGGRRSSAEDARIEVP